MKFLMKRGAMLVMLLALASAGMGCQHHEMKRLDVNVRLSDALLEHIDSKDNKYPNLDVDIVGVPDSSFAYWSNVKMSDYWDVTTDGKAKEPRASASSFPIRFANGTTGALSLPKDDPIWDVWARNNVMHLFVMSSYPRVGEDHPGDDDTRRAIIPLDAERWDKATQSVDVQIDRTRVTLITTPKPDKP